MTLADTSREATPFPGDSPAAADVQGPADAMAASGDARRNGIRATAIVLGVVFVALVGFRIYLAQGMVVPSLYSDEIGYFANARYLAGREGPQFVPRSPTVSFGYSLLLVPLYRWLDDSAEIYRWALRINAVVASALVFALFLVARSLFALPRLTSAWLASLASLYPPLLVNSNFAWTENVLPMLSMAWVLAVVACWQRRTFVSALVLALVCGVLFAAHARTFPLVILGAGCLLFLAWRRRLHWSAVLGALAVLAALVAATIALNGVLHDRMWGFERNIVVVRTRDKLLTPKTWLQLPLAAVGQSWYLLASTAGLVGLGAWRLYRTAVSPRSTERRESRRVGAVTVLTGGAAMFALSVAFCAAGKRVDQLVYGRYNESFVPVLVMAAVAWLLGSEGGRRLDRILVAGTAALALAPFVIFVRLGPA
jgi:hypothetical protein